MKTERRHITSFDRTESLMCEVVFPESINDMETLRGRAIIARGAGMSYCAASLSEDAVVVDMRSMNRILQFDPDGLFVEVEAGIAIGDLNEHLMERGFCISILPGYPSISVGGCVAFNIHGKSQYRTGTFLHIVHEIKLFHPLHGVVCCSESNKPELFSITNGGMGLTGIILSVTLKMTPLKGGKMEVKRVDCQNILDAIRIMKSVESEHEHVYSWNNLNLRGKYFGKGMVYMENYVQGSLKSGEYRNRLNFAYQFPVSHNNFTIRMMCWLYSAMENLKGKSRVLDLHQASFPIYRKEIYFRLFGKRGFREYQMILPYDQIDRSMLEIEKLIHKHDVAPSLGSLKLFRGEKKWLRFDGDGVCLALDVRNDFRSIPFFEDLDRVCNEYHAIVNISKDSRLNSDTVSALFEEYDMFKAEIKRFDEFGMMQSALKTRLKLES